MGGSLLTKIRENVHLPEYFGVYLSGLVGRRLDLAVNRPVLCPFHKETDASLHFISGTDTFYCYGCEVGGNIVTAHRLSATMYRGVTLSFRDALLELAALYKDRLGDISGLDLSATKQESIRRQFGSSAIWEYHTRILMGKGSLDDKIKFFAGLDTIVNALVK